MLNLFFFSWTWARISEPKRQVRLDPLPETYEPKHGDWMHDYNDDYVAQCLVKHGCTNNYEPVCANEITHENECVGKCRGGYNFIKGECGGCLSPNMCCQDQTGGVTKEIHWDTHGNVETHTVCVPSDGRRCGRDQICMHKQEADILAEPMNPASGMIPIDKEVENTKTEEH